MAALGRLLLCLACASPAAATTSSLHKSMAFVSATFSTDMQQLLLLLLSNPTQNTPTVRAHCPSGRGGGRG